jgi:hypothetical protein
MGDLEARLDAIESRLAIGQLPIRYALAVDSRDIDSWVELFVPDVRVAPGVTGREALKAQISRLVRQFKRSIHQVVGHRIDLDPEDADRATGAVYCRAEHEVGDRWIVMAICYFDTYERVDGDWLFRRRKERHWYAADVLRRPQDVGFADWDLAGVPALPSEFPTWSRFWDTSGSNGGR